MCLTIKVCVWHKLSLTIYECLSHKLNLIREVKLHQLRDVCPTNQEMSPGPDGPESHLGISSYLNHNMLLLVDGNLPCVSRTMVSGRLGNKYVMAGVKCYKGSVYFTARGSDSQPSSGTVETSSIRL